MALTVQSARDDHVHAVGRTVEPELVHLDGHRARTVSHERSVTEATGIDALFQLRKRA